MKNNSDFIWRETFNYTTFNAAQILAAGHIVIENRETAEKDRNLPHNSFVLANQNLTCTLYLFLDNFSDQDNPDYIVFPAQTITVPVEDGITFTHLFIKNTHAADAVAAKEIKVKLSTLKRIRAKIGV